uniref:Exuperantia RNAse H-like domain-containing protein n=1 Tax=Bracon brevicornis TaxID=1563983 RepID=A0A6V7JBQ7_9HYME
MKSRRGKFRRQILPTTLNLSERVTNMTGLEISQGKMYDLDGNKLQTVDKKLAMKGILEFLLKFERPIILVAHNAHNFASAIILRVMEEVGLLNRFKKLVIGFADTLPIIRQKLPNRQADGKNYKLRDLSNEFLKMYSEYCDALDNVEALYDLIKCIGITRIEIEQHSQSLQYLANRFQLTRLARTRSQACDEDGSVGTSSSSM